MGFFVYLLYLNFDLLTLPPPAPSPHTTPHHTSPHHSYRLAVHEPGADIDCICVAPNVCTREDFFGSLAPLISSNPQVTRFQSVSEAFVPIMTFYFDGVNIDLLFARVNTNCVRKEFDIDSDEVMVGIDTATEKSLNGPRTTNLIAKLVTDPTNPTRYKNFLIVVRLVRKWAKAKVS